MVEFNFMILDEDMEKLFEIMEHEKVSMSGNEYAKELLVSEIKRRYRDIKGRAKAEEKILKFDQWKTEYYPGWYLNSQEKDEELFEEWLKYKKKEEEKNK